MAGPQRIEWRRRSPRRALNNLCWYGVIAVLLLACFWLLFGNEPQQLDDGSANPLASLPRVLTVVAAAGALVMVVPVLRQPMVAASHYALVVRPGWGRTLSLPWAGIAEIAVVSTGYGRYLVIRSRPGPGHPGARPGWLDQAALRRLRRARARRDAPRPGHAGRDATSWQGRGQAAGYDLAVPLAGFVGGVQAQLGSLAAFAPDTVAVVSEPVP